jgi:hypothetical protein
MPKIIIVTTSVKKFFIVFHRPGPSSNKVGPRILDGLAQHSYGGQFYRWPNFGRARPTDLGWTIIEGVSRFCPAQPNPTDLGWTVIDGVSRSCPAQTNRPRVDSNTGFVPSGSDAFRAVEHIAEYMKFSFTYLFGEISCGFGTNQHSSICHSLHLLR